MIPAKPSLVPDYVAAPAPGRVRPGDVQTIYVQDAGMIYDSPKLWPCKAHDTDYARYEGFSSTKAGGVSTIFTTSHRELDTLDWIKMFWKMTSNTDSWARGTRGKGVVKQYGSMRTLSYLFQPVNVSTSELRAGYMGGHEADVPQKPAKNPFCPTMDEERNDLRLGAIYACILAMRVRYPGATIHVYLRGDRIVGRYNDLVGVHGSLADKINNTANSVVLGQKTSHFATDMNNHLNVGSRPPATATTPQLHLPVNPPIHFELSDISKDPKTKQWNIDPSSIPLFSTPPKIEP